MSTFLSTGLAPALNLVKAAAITFAARGPLRLGVICLARRGLSTSTKEDLSNFTRGRFVTDEKSNLEKRRIHFNLDALRKAAAAATGSRECVEINKFPEGNFNKAFLLKMDDGKEVVAKLPNPNAGIARLTTASEVASMDFFRRVTKTPAPQVLDYCANGENPVGSEYIIMEKVTGVVLSSVWRGLSLETKKKIISKLVMYYQAWSHIIFDEYGSLYFPEDLGLKPHGHSAVGREWTSEGKYNLSSERGPFQTFFDYKKAALEREKQAIVTLDGAFPRQTGMICGPPPFYLSTVDKKLKALEEYDLCLQHSDLIFSDENTDLFKGYIWHNDMHTENIFVDPKDPATITGIVDWQSSQIAPLIDHCLDPHLLGHAGLDIGQSPASLPLPSSIDSWNSGERASFEDRALMNTWRSGVKKHIAKQHRALAFEKTTPGRILHLARHLLGPSEAHLAVWLKFLKDDLHDANGGKGKEFPLKFSP
ncbi:hypothetical protein KEM56_006069, partial [Ascosphaera pollenicola]